MYIVNSNSNECDLERKDNYPPDAEVEYIKDSGCYYLRPELCKDMIVNVGAIGNDTPTAIKTLQQQIKRQELLNDTMIPAFRWINKEVVSCYASELAVCLVKAAACGKGLEITIGYPRILVIKVN